MTKKVSVFFLVLSVLVLVVLLGGFFNFLKRDKNEKVKIVFGTWAGQPEETAMIKKQIEAFKEKYPNIDVEHRVVVGDYAQTLQTEFAAGVAPDVFYLDIVDTDSFIDKKVVMPLDQYISKNTINSYLEGVKKAFQDKNGTTYGLSKDSASLVMYYNIDYFEKAGVSDVPENWNELENALSKIKKAMAGGVLGKKIMTPLALVPDGVRVAPFIYQNSGKIIDGESNINIASQETAEAFDFYFGLIRKGYADTPANLGTGWLGSAFGEGKAALVFSGTWTRPFLKTTAPDLRYDLAPIPFSKQAKTMFFTVAYAVNSKTKHKEAAARFVEFTAGIEGQRIVLGASHALPTIKALAQEYIQKYPENRVFMEQTGVGIPWKWGVNARKIDAEMKFQGEKMILDKNYSGLQAVKAIQEKLN